MLMTMDKKPRKDLQAVYPAASKHAIRLLNSFLQFAPHQRVLADDALLDPYFDNIKAQGYIPGHKPGDEKAVFSPQSGTTTEVSDASPGALCLNPMSVDREKVRESQLNLKYNFVQEILSFNYMRREERESSL
jgi:hypothetical protein